MSQAPDIDGVLITWGDRLFYPGNRIVKVKPQPKLNGDSACLCAAAIRERIEAVQHASSRRSSCRTTST